MYLYKYNFILLLVSWILLMLLIFNKRLPSREIRAGPHLASETGRWETAGETSGAVVGFGGLRLNSCKRTSQTNEAVRTAQDMRSSLCFGMTSWPCKSLQEQHHTLLYASQRSGFAEPKRIIHNTHLTISLVYLEPEWPLFWITNPLNHPK